MPALLLVGQLLVYVSYKLIPDMLKFVAPSGLPAQLFKNLVQYGFVKVGKIGGLAQDRRNRRKPVFAEINRPKCQQFAPAGA